jgi:hypothetical protein
MPKHERNKSHHQNQTAQNIFQVESHYDHEERGVLKMRKTDEIKHRLQAIN